MRNGVIIGKERKGVGQNRVHFSWSMMRGPQGPMILRCESQRFKMPHWAVVNHLMFVRAQNHAGAGGAGKYICQHCLISSGEPH